MTTKNGDMPAAPTLYADMAQNGQREIYCDNLGLTKREQFAMAAMQGLCSNDGLRDAETECKLAVQMADALLAELEK